MRRRAPIYWFHRLQFRLAAALAAALLAMIGAAVIVNQTSGRSSQVERHFDLLRQAGNGMVQELGQLIESTEVLAQAVALLGERLPDDMRIYEQVLPALMQENRNMPFIAGGGIWPDPGMHNTGDARRSIFWTLTADGGLRFHEPYPMAADRQQLYEMARHTTQNGCLWSPSYTSLYASEPTVTCMVVMRDQKRYLGVASIDLRLGELRTFFAERAQRLDGYAFAVDDNNTLLSFPDNALEARSGSPLHSVEQLAQGQTLYQPLAQRLRFLSSIQPNGAVQQIIHDGGPSRLARVNNARTDKAKQATALLQFVLEDDPLLHEAVLVSVFPMPETLWKIVLVMPERIAAAGGDAVTARLVWAMSVVLLLSMLGALAWMRGALMEPLLRLTDVLKGGSEAEAHGKRAVQPPPRNELGELAHYASKRSHILQRARAALRESGQQVRHMATHDALTELPNRMLFLEHLHRATVLARRDQTRLALLCLELDNVRALDETFDHTVGDRVLREVTARLLGKKRRSDILTRIGGSQFALILPGLRDPGGLTRVAQDIINTLSDGIMIDRHEIHLGVNIGITFYPGDGNRPEQLIRNAELAMRKARAEGRNTFRCFTRDMTLQLQQRQALEEQLGLAIAANAFELHFQPLVHAVSGQGVSAEAVLRWHRPGHGLTPPEEFIAVAEQSGLILALDDWSIDQVCARITAWMRAGRVPLSVALPISATRFLHPAFPAAVDAVLERYRTPPHLLCFEITENMLAQDVPLATTIMRQLRDRGIRLAIDAFGSGRSRLPDLKRVPVDQLNLSRDLVSEVVHSQEDLAIAQAVIALGHGLHMRVAAKGVETAAQASALRAAGCDRLQGDHVAPPMPVDDFTDWISRPPAWRPGAGDA
ncbi:MAG: EAL domain-containing protein [Aquisalimonadaceae bacterium]